MIDWFLVSVVFAVGFLIMTILLAVTLSKLHDLRMKLMVCFTEVQHLRNSKQAG